MGYSNQQMLQEALRKRCRIRQCGLIAIAFVRAFGILLLAFALYGILDYILAFRSRSRFLLDLVLLSGAIALLVGWILDGMRYGLRDMAKHLDSATQDPRRSALSAYELSCRNTDAEVGREDPLSQYLSTSAIQRCQSQLGRCGYKYTFPWQELRKTARSSGILLILSLFVVVINFSASHVIASRLLFPFRDIPPYSQYQFAVAPLDPTVLYGGDLELTVTVTGGPVDKQVWCLTRQNQQVTRTACYREPGGRFVQRLERVTKPTEFCFTVGKARTEWGRVNIQYRPEIASIRAMIRPPAYTQLPIRDVLIGDEPLKVLKGSTVALRVKSNRSIATGEIVLQEKTERSEKITMGEPVDEGAFLFSWTAEYEGDLLLTIRDVTGTPNREPIVIKQEILLDQSPDPTLELPPRHALAVAGSRLPIRGHVRDDYGLRSAGLVRSLVGYRDRLRPEVGVTGQKDHKVTDEIDLGALGVQPGDVLEIYLEAADSNPSLGGVAMSDVSRVDVISQDEYAEMLREQTTIDAFLDRFRESHRLLKELETSTATLQETLDEQPDEHDLVEAQLEDMRKKYQALQQEYAKLASDFAIYDVEESLQAQLTETMDVLNQHEAWLSNAKPTDSDLAKEVGRFAESVGLRMKTISEEMDNAEYIAAIARVYQDAQRFEQLVQSQAELVRRLERFSAQSLGAGSSILSVMQERQSEIQQELESFSSDLLQHAKELPADMEFLAVDAIQFVKMVESAEISDQMSDAIQSAESQNGRATWQSASLALERMRALIPPLGQEGEEGEMPESGQNNFASLCSGGNCQGKRPGLSESLAQMLESLRKGRSSGASGMIGGGGGGMGGNANDGYWVPGQSSLDVPVYGPPRSKYGRNRQGAEGHSGTARGSGANQSLPPHARESMNVIRADKAHSRSMLIEELPGKYRDAVKSYFSPESSSEGVTP